MNKTLFLLSFIVALLTTGTVDAKKKKYPNGNYYEGKMKKGEPHGIGIMIYANGDIYKGEWNEGMCHGTGNMVYKNGNIYEGQWQVNGACGYGIMKYANGNVYEGSWLEGLQNGYGTMKYSNGSIYIGNWLKGKYWRGKLTANDGSWFDGEWINDIFYTGTCKGEINECFYEGTWKEGCFVDGVCNGDIFPSFQFNGEIRDKTYYNGTGKGEINGNYYEGKWIDGKFIGECRIKATKEHPAFFGKMFADGTMNGKIKFDYDVTYEGALSTSFIPSGKGVLSYQYEKRGSCLLSGIWKDGKLVELNKGNIFIGATPIAVKISNENLVIGNSTKIPNQYNIMTRNIENYIDNVYSKIRHEQIIAKLKTYRGENYKIAKTIAGAIVSEVKYLYNFGDAEYQYYPTPKKDILYGRFHVWNGRYWGSDESFAGNILYSAQGFFKNGEKVGEWIFEEKDKYGNLKRRLIINYKNGLKFGLSTLETYGKNGSKMLIKAYYNNDQWEKKGTTYYYYNKSVSESWLSTDLITTITERNVSFDNEEKLHGTIFIKQNEIELREVYEHGKLINSEKRNIKKGIVLSPKRDENRFQEMWEVVLPAAFPLGSYDFRVDRDPLIGMTFVNFEEESEYDTKKINRLKEESNR